MIGLVFALALQVAPVKAGTGTAGTGTADTVPLHSGTLAVVTARGVDLGGTPLGDARRVTSLAVDPAGLRLAEVGGIAGEGGVLRVWDVARRELLWERELHGDLIYGVAWSPGGETLYTAGGDRRVGVVSADGERVAYLEGHGDQVLCVAVSKSGLLATGCLDGTIKVWREGALLRTLARHGDRVTSLAFDPAGAWLASGSADHTVRIWQPEQGRMRAILRDHEGVVLALAWSADRLVSGCSDGAVRELEPLRAQVLGVYHRHGDWVRGVALSDGWVISSDPTGTVLRSEAAGLRGAR